MSIKKTLTTIGLVLVGTLMGSLPAEAVVVPNPVSNDIFVSFRASGGVGGSTSYIVNLGPASQFTQSTALTIFSGLGIGADLNANFGSDWYTRTDVYWSIYGHNTNSNDPILYGSRERVDNAVRTDPYAALDLNSRQNTDTQIVSVIELGYRGSTATANNPLGTFQANSSAASSYNFQVATEGTSDFGSLSGWTTIEGSFGSGDSVLDLWRYAGSGTTYRGNFTIDSAGVISFNAAAVPEPSTYALLAVAGMALLFLRHRRSVRA